MCHIDSILTAGKIPDPNQAREWLSNVSCLCLAAFHQGYEMNHLTEFLPSGLLPETVDEALEAVMHVANRVLAKCNVFSLAALKEGTPSIREIAFSLRVICKLIEDLQELGAGGDDIFTSAKAHEYTDHVEAIAKAIEAENEDELKRQVQSLQTRSFIL